MSDTTLAKGIASQLATVEPISATALTPYGDSPESDKPERPPCFGTISAGFKTSPDGNPIVERNGIIHVQPKWTKDGDKWNQGYDEENEGLRRILRDSPKELVITFLKEDEPEYLHMMFTKRSRSRLEAFGDHKSITEIRLVPDLDENGRQKVNSKRELQTKPERVIHAVGTPGYEAIRKVCKVEHFVYFALATWDPVPSAIFPDGFGVYRLRFTSENSLANLRGCIKMIRSFTRGRIAGVPITISHKLEERTDPSGTRRSVPIWNFRMKQPGGLVLKAREVGLALSASIEEAGFLHALPAPAELQEADVEAEFEELSEVADHDAARLQTGAFDASNLKRAFFALLPEKHPMNDSPSPSRAQFVKDYTHSLGWGTPETSLARFFELATYDEAVGVLPALMDYLGIEPTRDEDPATRPWTPADPNHEHPHNKIEPPKDDPFAETKAPVQPEAPTPLPVDTQTAEPGPSYPGSGAYLKLLRLTPEEAEAFKSECAARDIDWGKVAIEARDAEVTDHAGLMAYLRDGETPVINAQFSQVVSDEELLAAVASFELPSSQLKALQVATGKEGHAFQRWVWECKEIGAATASDLEAMAGGR